MAPLQRISPCLWFDSQAEEAARAYTAIFPRSRITTVTRYGEAGQEIHGRAPGSVMVVAFELDGQAFTALNGGPLFIFSEAISLQVHCDTQAEIDHYWAQLGAGGDPRAQQCGWLKDRFGLSWQIVPRQIEAWLSDPDSRRADRVMAAVLQMKKLDLAAIEHAFSGA
ncbi:MAG: VOC family protein [Burkholderiaceae bacterium]|jgi:predicted 3-demethylubiquinone-9 3-methyltransferase (glyoxalase superfamily)|nr:VOC family protein [Burkholderiaceae bacterium]